MNPSKKALRTTKQVGSILPEDKWSQKPLPQVTETKPPQSADVTGEALLYHESMTRIYLADAKPEERRALRLLLLDLNMDVVGEAADWATTFADAPATTPDMLLVDSNLLPSAPAEALGELRRACSTALVIVLISQLDAREQAAFSVGADAFISKHETPEMVAGHLRTFAERVCTGCGLV